MCPACIGNAAWIVAGALSAGGAGGWTAIVLRRPRESGLAGRGPDPGAGAGAGSRRQARTGDGREPRTIKEDPA